MSVIKSEIDKKVKNEEIIKAPMLFSVAAKGKVNYLLLTGHAISLSEFPPQCMSVIHSCTSYVTEESTEDAEKFYMEAIFRPKRSKPWIAQLSYEIINFLEKGVTKFLEITGIPLEALGPRSDLINRLHIWAAYYFVEYGYRNLIVESTKKNENNSNFMCMDLELIEKVFKAKPIYGLEDLCSKIPMHINSGSTVEDIRKLYQEIKEIMSKMETDKDKLPLKSDKEDTESLEVLCDNYRQAKYLVSSKLAIEQNEDEETIDRNLRWLPKFSILHDSDASKGSKLFGVGVCHGIGEWGLLSLLPKSGYKLKRITPNDTFEDYTYPFQSEIVYARTLSQEKLMISWTREINDSLLMYQYDRFIKRKTHQNHGYKPKKDKKALKFLID